MTLVPSKWRLITDGYAAIFSSGKFLIRYIFPVFTTYVAVLAAALYGEHSVDTSMLCGLATLAAWLALIHPLLVWIRSLCVDAPAGAHAAAWSFGKQEWRLLACLLMITISSGLVITISLAVWSQLRDLYDSNSSQPTSTAITVAGATAIIAGAFYVYSRLSPAMAIAAVEKRIDLVAGWRLSSSQGFRLPLCFVAIAIPLGLGAGLIVAPFGLMLMKIDPGSGKFALGSLTLTTRTFVSAWLMATIGSLQYKAAARN